MNALNQFKTNPLATFETESEASSLFFNITKLEFLEIACLWSRVPTKIVVVSKGFQRENMTIDGFVKHINGLRFRTAQAFQLMQKR